MWTTVHASDADPKEHTVVLKYSLMYHIYSPPVGGLSRMSII